MPFVFHSDDTFLVGLEVRPTSIPGYQAESNEITIPELLYVCTSNSFSSANERHPGERDSHSYLIIPGQKITRVLSSLGRRTVANLIDLGGVKTEVKTEIPRILYPVQYTRELPEPSFL